MILGDSLDARLSSCIGLHRFATKMKQRKQYSFNLCLYSKCLISICYYWVMYKMLSQCAQSNRIKLFNHLQHQVHELNTISKHRAYSIRNLILLAYGTVCFLRSSTHLRFDYIYQRFEVLTPSICSFFTNPFFRCD